MASSVDERPVVDEVQYYHDASLGAAWTASRTLIAATATLYGGFAFAFFYLRSLNSHGMFQPHGQSASFLIGTMITVFMVVSAFLQTVSAKRLRKGLTFDWQVGGTIALGLGVAAGLMQIWMLTRLPFLPGASGYAGVYVSFAPVNALVILLIMYWLETLVARSIRNRKVMAQDGGIGVSSQPNAESFRASLDGLTVFLDFFALLSVVFWYILYVL